MSTENDTKYPTKWKRSDMRGCGSNGSETCQRMHLPVESRLLDKTTLQKRHIHPKSEVIAAIEAKTNRLVDTGRAGRQWWATLINGSRADNERRRVYGATEREALQNLADKMKVTA